MSYPFGRQSDNMSQPSQPSPSQSSVNTVASVPQQQQQQQQQQPQTQTQQTQPLSQAQSSSQQQPHTENPQVIETLNKLNYAQMSRLLNNQAYQRNVLAAARGNLLSPSAVKHVQTWIEERGAQQRKAMTSSSSSPSPSSMSTPTATASTNSSTTTKSPFQMLQLIREKMPTMQTYLARPDLTEAQRTQVKNQIDQMLAKWQEITGQTFPNGSVSNIGRPQSASSLPSGGESAGIKSELADKYASKLEERRGIVAKRKIKEMLPDPDDAESDVEDLLADVTDEFIESVVHYACRLARHRKSDRLEIKDVAIHLDRAWGIRVPGFSMDEIKQANSKRPPINLSSNYALNLQAVKEASKKRTS